MERFVARANVDHYLHLLKVPDISSHSRATITKLLIEQENKLGRETAQTRVRRKQGRNVPGARRPTEATDGFIPPRFGRLGAG